MKSELRNTVEKVVKDLYPGINNNDLLFSIDSTDKPEHGDFATNVAMQLTKLLKRSPKSIADEIVQNIAHPDIADVVTAGPGFINFFIKAEAYQRWLEMLLQSSDGLKSTIGQGRRVMVEFVSANPTGPLHIGHGRGAVVGDCVTNILSAAGYKVYREYYVNDAGNQMNNLAKSILSKYYEQNGEEYPFPADGYHGDYIGEIAAELGKVYNKKLLKVKEGGALDICKRAGIKSILAGIDATLRRFNVNMDGYFSETSLYENGDIDKTLGKLKKTSAVYEKDGAIWLSTEKLGDEKDRVLQKSDGSYTYLTPDIAYHRGKFERGFDLLVDVWGADHHGYVKRMECALKLLEHDEKSFDVVLVQMVSLLKDGERMVMSTRAGQFVTLDWLIDEVGIDAARFFYNMRSASSQFEFDLDLAKSRSSDNPVYYVQYAHARVSSLLANAKERGIDFSTALHLDKLTLPQEKKLIKKMMECSSVIETAAMYNEPHRMSYYLMELAGEFHTYYYNTVIINEEDAEHSAARLNLCRAVALAVKFGLSLLGVSAPERM